MSSPDISGVWINQNGSTVELFIEDGVITGWYCSQKGRSAKNKRYPLVGQQNDEIVAFQVDWQDDESNLNAITSFSGRIVGGGKEIHTVWVLARQFEDEALQKPTGAWNAFLTNSDVFTRFGSQHHG
jgi:hypothetical protein